MSRTKYMDEFGIHFKFAYFFGQRNQTISKNDKALTKDSSATECQCIWMRIRIDSFFKTLYQLISDISNSFQLIRHRRLYKFLRNNKSLYSLHPLYDFRCERLCISATLNNRNEANRYWENFEIFNQNVQSELFEPCLNVCQTNVPSIFSGCFEKILLTTEAMVERTNQSRRWILGVWKIQM